MSLGKRFLKKLSQNKFLVHQAALCIAAWHDERIVMTVTEMWVVRNHPPIQRAHGVVQNHPPNLSQSRSINFPREFSSALC